MERRPLGRSGLVVPVIGMGTWNTFDVHGAAKERDRRGVVDAALAAGTTLFDTSPMYGDSPAVLAKAVSGRRENVQIADKIWTNSPTDGRAQIARSLELFEGMVDVYQIHNLVGWRDHLPVLEDLRAKGSFRSIGATHYAHSAFGALMEVMRTGRIDMVQVPYSATDRVVEKEVLPLAAELGLGVLVMEPLGTGKLVRRAPPKRELAPLEAFGVHNWPQALLKWILSDPRVTAVLPATSKADHATENAVAGQPPWLDQEARSRIAALASAL